MEPCGPTQITASNNTYQGNFTAIYHVKTTPTTTSTTSYATTPDSLGRHDRRMHQKRVESPRTSTGVSEVQLGLYAELRTDVFLHSSVFTTSFVALSLPRLLKLEVGSNAPKVGKHI
ncbi:MAG TPA: hypothetical protein V6C97_27885 [Oculatellaceae cyanobacterium]